MYIQGFSSTDKMGKTWKGESLETLPVDGFFCISWLYNGPFYNTFLPTAPNGPDWAAASTDHIRNEDSLSRTHRPLVREGAQSGQDSNSETETNISSWAPEGDGHQDRQTDCP